MKNIYLKALAWIFSAVLVFASCDDADKICDDADKIDVSTGELNGHEWVDLGLSVRWATCNVGASVPSECGDYYAWGEVETKTEYTEETSLTSGVEIGDISGNPRYDAATANWGEGWRMPTEKEYSELCDECDWAWTSIDGMAGYKVTGPNGNSIFLPAAGYRYRSSLDGVVEYVNYWSSTPYESGTLTAYYLNSLGGSYGVSRHNRIGGYSVRPVSDKSFTTPGQGSGNESGGQTEDYYEIVVSNEWNEAFSIEIEMQSDWLIENTARWFSVSPLSGEAGLYEIAVQVIKLNTGNAERSAEFVIYDGDRLIYVTVIQPSGGKISGELNGHEWIDLGLSVRWAACNVGASVSSDYGDYYAWGEIETKTEYTEENSLTYGVELGDISGNPQYDAATANWGEGWRMPTEKEYSELCNECDWEWTSLDGMAGYNVTGPNGNSIFLPAAGYRYRSLLHHVGWYGYYWSSTPYESGTQSSYTFFINSDSHITNIGVCYNGFSVRPVSDK